MALCLVDDKLKGPSYAGGYPGVVDSAACRTDAVDRDAGDDGDNGQILQSGTG